MGKAIENTEIQDTPRAASLQECRCGCGEVTNAGRLFRQGHDQRLIGKLAFDVVQGTGRGLNILSADEAKLDIQERINRITKQVEVRLSGALAAKFHNAAMSRWAKENKQKSATNVGPRHPVDAFAGTDDEPVGQAPELATNGYGLGADVRVKVGRYTYDGVVTGMNQAGKVTAVTYKNKAGNEKVIAAPKEIKLV